MAWLHSQPQEGSETIGLCTLTAALMCVWDSLVILPVIQNVEEVFHCEKPLNVSHRLGVSAHTPNPSTSLEPA